MIKNLLPTKAIAYRGYGGNGFGTSRQYFQLQDYENIPLIPVSKSLQWQADVYTTEFWRYDSEPTFISPMGDALSRPPDKIMIPFPQAVPILNEYIQKVFIIKNTIQWMDYASEKSKSKTGETESSKWSIGISVDLGKLLEKSFGGNVDGNLEKQVQLAFTLYVEQAKKYLLTQKKGRIDDEYLEKLVGIELKDKEVIYTTDINNAHGAIKWVNTVLDKRLKEHFDILKSI